MGGEEKDVQPLVLPDGEATGVLDEVAEEDERERGDDDAGHQQQVEPSEHGELGVLLVLLQVVDGAHEAAEDPEVDQRVHAAWERRRNGTLR